MISTVSVVTPPAIEPLTLDRLRAHCRIDHTSDDDLLAGYLRAARTMAEQYLSRCLITQTLQWTLTPTDPLQHTRHRLWGALEMPRGPVQSITSVTAMDSYGNATSISAASLPIVPPAVLLGYKADLAHVPARLTIGRDTVLVDGRTLGQVQLDHLAVQFVAGYGLAPDTIPAPILDAVALITAFLYEHRGDAGGEIPKAAEWLLDPYRLMWLA